MNRLSFLYIALLGLFLNIVEAAPNVLMLVVDDLRVELGCYGNSQVQTPNIDKLAKQGVLFEKAYCQEALCNPSRSSVLTGLSPDTLKIWGNHVHFRDQIGNKPTLPEIFKLNGYHSEAIGKIYHGVFPKENANKWDSMDDATSWSVPATRFGPRYYYTEPGIASAKKVFAKKYPKEKDWTSKLVFGPMTEAPNVSDDVLYDGKVARYAEKRLMEFSELEQPFFLAVGFIKPHTPFIAPKKYWDLYDKKNIRVNEEDEFVKNAPKYAFHPSNEIRRYTDQPNKGLLGRENKINLKHGYYACISYIDAQIGKVMDALDKSGQKNETIVILWSDHGYHIGDQGLWGKLTNFEKGTKVPLIVSSPNLSKNKRSGSLVELLDIYPTLCELAGIKAPVHIEGRSFMPLMQDPNKLHRKYARSQIIRGNMNKGIGVMGKSIRSSQYRFTKWIDTKKKSWLKSYMTMKI